MISSPRGLLAASAAAIALSGCVQEGGGSGSGSGTAPPAFDADLTVVSLAFDPLNVNAGSTILATDVVRNTGTETAPAFRVGVYLSQDDTVTTSDLLLGFRTVASLDPGDQSIGGGELTIPHGTAAGTYWLGAIADDADEIGEPDEGNNVTVAGDTLAVETPDLADLAVGSVSFAPLVVEAGDQIQVQDRVDNLGDAPATGFQVALYLSSDSTVTTADSLLAVRVVSSLDPGGSDLIDGSVTIPVSTPAGFYYVGAIADSGEVVHESDEGNNAAVASTTLNVGSPPLPDLVPTHVNFHPTAVDAGTEIQLSEGVLNQGLASAASFQVGVYLSADSVIDASDVLLGFRSVGGLDPGGTSAVVDQPLEIPPDTSAAVYWGGVVADDNELVPEGNESNNDLVASTTLVVSVPPLPNLRPKTIDFSPTVVNVDEGDLLHVSESVENVGTAAAGAFRVGVYLSTNSVVTPSDVLITSRMVTALGPGGSSGAAKDVALPGGLSDGSYFLGVIADDLDEQGEVGEGDNVLVADELLDVVSTPDPKPDLACKDCTYSGHIKAPGATFQVVTEVINEGTLSALPFHVGVYLSVDAEISPDDVLLGERYLLAGLASGFTNVASASVTIPSDQPEGIYYLGAYADNRFEVVELDEDDNAFTAVGTLEVKSPPPPAPELYVASSSHDGGTHSPGDTLTVSETVRNGGELAAGAFRVGYYLSNNATISLTDVLLGTRTLPSLDVGAEDFASTLLAIPPGTSPGDYWLGVIVDDQEAVTENDEQNNFHTVQPKITIQ